MTANIASFYNKKNSPEDTHENKILLALSWSYVMWMMLVTIFKKATGFGGNTYLLGPTLACTNLFCKYFATRSQCFSVEVQCWNIQLFPFWKKKFQWTIMTFIYMILFSDCVYIFLFCFFFCWVIFCKLSCQSANNSDSLVCFRPFVDKIPPIP
jgi:hypothetical protein